MPGSLHWTHHTRIWVVQPRQMLKTIRHSRILYSSEKQKPTIFKPIIIKLIAVVISGHVRLSRGPTSHLPPHTIRLQVHGSFPYDIAYSTSMASNSTQSLSFMESSCFSLITEPRFLPALLRSCGFDVKVCFGTKSGSHLLVRLTSRRSEKSEVLALPRGKKLYKLWLLSPLSPLSPVKSCYSGSSYFCFPLSCSWSLSFSWLLLFL